MNLYQRVALANPKGAREVIKSYGYDIRTNNLPNALRMLVSAEGEPALRSIVNIHPDKEIILECFGKQGEEHKHEDCKCKDKHKEDNKDKMSMDAHYLNAAGYITEAQKQSDLTKTFLIVASVMILGSLIIKQ
jgi:hypothetical protein